MNLSIYLVRFTAPTFNGVAVSVASDKNHAEQMTRRRLRKQWQVTHDPVLHEPMDVKMQSRLGNIETKKFAEIVHLDITD